MKESLLLHSKRSVSNSVSTLDRGPLYYPHASFTLKCPYSICNNSAKKDEFGRVSLNQTTGAWWLFGHINVAELIAVEFYA